MDLIGAEAGAKYRGDLDALWFAIDASNVVQAAAGALFYFPGTGVWRVLVDEPDAIDLSDEDPKLALRGGGKSKEFCDTDTVSDEV